jgi:hypothetical protein
LYGCHVIQTIWELAQLFYSMSETHRKLFGEELRGAKEGACEWELVENPMITAD